MSTALSFCPPPKVLISGAFATGKTTLALGLARMLKGEGIRAVVVADVARHCPFPLNKEQNPGVSMWLIAEQIHEEMAACLGDAELVICDRGVPDILSHTVVLDLRTQADLLYAGLATKIASVWVPTYDAVLWATIDPSKGIQPDGLRLIDREYQGGLEGAISSLFERLAVKAVALPNADEDRFRVARAIVRELLGRGSSGGATAQA